MGSNFVFMAACSFVLSTSAALAGAPPAATPDSIAKGKSSFTTNCVTCHGELGDGNGPAGAMMNPKPRNLSDTKSYKGGSKPADMFKTVSEGLKGTSMTAFGHLPEDERWALVHYIQATFATKKK